jgi:hypothetical protein
MKNGLDIVTGDNLEKIEKDRTNDKIEKRKKLKLLYIVIVSGVDFFCAGVCALWLNIDHTQSNMFWNRTSYRARQELL